MKKTLLLLFGIMLLFGSNSFSQNTRSLGYVDEGEVKNISIGKQYLLIIGISKYLNWIPLGNPAKDTREIKNILTSKYRIDEVRELYDEKATKAEILKTFSDLQKELTIEDSLLILYAGHGQYDQNTKTGYWIPYDAGTNVYEQDRWIPNHLIHGFISHMDAIHICLISDSCFSGDILNIMRGSVDDIESDYFKRAYSLVSRQVITSGALEMVPDASSFCQMLKIVLKKNSSPYLDPMMIFNEIRLGVTETTPLFGSLKGSGHQEGASFLLFLKEPEEKIQSHLPINKDEQKKKDKQWTKESFFSMGIGCGLSIPFGEVEEIMKPGINPLLFLRFNIDLPFGILGFGIYTSAGNFDTKESFDTSYSMLSVPLAFQVTYMTSFFFPFYTFCDVGCGISLHSITFREIYEGLNDFITGKFYLSGGIGAGFIIHSHFWIETNATSSLILFDNTLYTDITPGIQLVYTF
ncbi:MAG: caspase family protein [Spirochaetales bacterium]|nr:caspase family protein [Spirochaetales bacterium]